MIGKPHNCCITTWLYGTGNPSWLEDCTVRQDPFSDDGKRNAIEQMIGKGAVCVLHCNCSSRMDGWIALVSLLFGLCSDGFNFPPWLVLARLRGNLALWTFRGVGKVCDRLLRVLLVGNQSYIGIIQNKWNGKKKKSPFLLKQRLGDRKGFFFSPDGYMTE